MSKQIKLFDPVINDDEVKAAVKVLKSRFWASGSGTGNVKNLKEYSINILVLKILLL